MGNKGVLHITIMRRFYPTPFCSHIHILLCLKNLEKRFRTPRQQHCAQQSLWQIPATGDLHLRGNGSCWNLMHGIAVRAATPGQNQEGDGITGNS